MRKAAQRIVEKLRLHGHEAFFAGGWVRDLLLRRKSSDIDIVTSALPEEVLRLFPKARAIGAKFGVVQVKMYGKPYDVATFRTESSYADGRHPSQVSFAGPREDALRRDFTINGLFYDPVAERTIDYVQGRVDLQRRVIRTIGDPRERFSEDKLRMLRAVRLACGLEFEIATETFRAIRSHAPEIVQVSWERNRDELLKILTCPARSRGLDLLHETGLLAPLLPEVEAMRGVAQPPERHPEGDVFVHTRSALQLLRNPTPVLAVGTLLHDVGKPLTFKITDGIHFDGHAAAGARVAEEICRRLRMSNEDTAAISELVSDHLRFRHIKEMRPGPLRRFLARPHFGDHLELQRVNRLSSDGNLENYKFALQKLLELEDQPPSPSNLITGHDLIEAGYRPGPQFRRILEYAEDLQAEAAYASREDILKQVLKTYPPEETEGAE